MDSRRSHSFLRILCCCAVVFLFAFPILAQEDDTDPNSPTPILLSEVDSNRALAVEQNTFGRRNLAKIETRAFLPETDIVLFVTNLELMKEEGANALRVYVNDKLGRTYRFPVTDLQPVRGKEWIYAVTVKLRDELGFWEQPAPDGDVNIYLAWRGLSSNVVKLGLGKIGGDIKDVEGAVPTPYKQFATKPVVVQEKAIQTSDYVGYRWSGDRMRFQEQAGFGPSTMLDSRIRRIGLRTWLADQFTAPYPTVPYPIIPLKNTNPQAAIIDNGCGPNDGSATYNACIRDHYNMYQAQNWFFKEAFYGDQQLRHRIAWTLSQIWVTSGVDIQQSSHIVAYHKVLSDNAFGNYRDLMKAMTLNPAMGDYLDMVRSTKNNPNENYPREILQLFTIGLYMLNQDGTVQTSQGVPVPSYTQDTVNNFTKVFTGWTYCNTGCPNSLPGLLNFKDPMTLNQTNHNITTKTLLTYPNAVNTNIAANLNGNAEIDLALDNVFNHPNVAPFVSKLFIQHLVTSDPTPAYVSRISAVFRDNGSGVRGDMKAVIKAILLDPEARGDVKTDPNFGKLREPVQLMTNVFRAFNVRSADGLQQSDGVLNGFSGNMSQSVFNAPTVFNYYTPGYVVPNTALVGPEFAILTTGTAISRTNFVNSAIMNATIVAVGTNTPQGTNIDLNEMQNLAAADLTGNQLLDALNQKMLHGTMSTQMRNIILPAVMAVPSNTPLQRARQAIYLVATSSQFQVQR
jgi:uncharacterized protein (DUF1800 family)